MITALVIVASVTLDPAIFASLVTAILGGGIFAAISAWRKTPLEVESISVSTLRGVIEELRIEVERLRLENQELRASITTLRQEVAAKQYPN